MLYCIITSLELLNNIITLWYLPIKIIFVFSKQKTTHTAHFTKTKKRINLLKTIFHLNTIY